MIFFNLIRAVVSRVLYLLEIMMLVRAVMSFVSPNASGKVFDFIYNVTEFFISPVRALLGRFEFVRRSPLDIPFFVTTLIIAIFASII